MNVSPEQREELARELGYQIAVSRHGQSVTASDLAERLTPWLAAVVRAAKADALEEAANALRYPTEGASYEMWASDVGSWLRARAAAYREGSK